MEITEYKKMDELQSGNWWYRGRRSVVSRFFKKYAKRDGKFLDVGCGTGEAINIVSNMGSLTGIDMSDEALSIAQSRGYMSLHKGIGERLPFSENAFDSILMLDVLEHIDDDRVTLAECFRVLKPYGTIFITVPAHQWLWSGHDETFGHKRRYKKSELIKKMKVAGFEVIFCSYYVTTPFPMVVAFRFIEKITRNKKRSHFFNIPSWINSILLFIARFEGLLLAHRLPMPFGSSIILIGRHHSE